MGNAPQDPLFPTPGDMETTRKEAVKVRKARQRIPALHEDARKAVNAYSANKNAVILIAPAERALCKLLDAVTADIKPTGSYSVELPYEFVYMIMHMMRALDYQQSFESYIMNNIASGQVNRGFVFQANWPGSFPDINRTPVVYIKRCPD